MRRNEKSGNVSDVRSIMNSDTKVPESGDERILALAYSHVLRGLGAPWGQITFPPAFCTSVRGISSRACAKARKGPALTPVTERARVCRQTEVDVTRDGHRISQVAVNLIQDVLQRPPEDLARFRARELGQEREVSAEMSRGAKGERQKGD